MRKNLAKVRKYQCKRPVFGWKFTGISAYRQSVWLLADLEPAREKG
jgi:hypothetical protein